MLEKIQKQVSGDNSTQFQVENLVLGITEQRAREIFNELFEIAQKRFSIEAGQIANKRIDDFKKQFIDKLMSESGNLLLLKDPYFQFRIINAQCTAATTDRKKDYDLLSELLLNRHVWKEGRKNRVAYSKAIEIVSDIDDDALTALTAIYSIILLEPDGKFCRSYKDILSTFDNLLKKVLTSNLPLGREWIEHLDMLNTARYSSTRSLKKIEQIFAERFVGYFSAGIRFDSDEYNKALKILHEINFDKSLLAKNDLIDGYWIVPVMNFESIQNLTVTNSSTGKTRCISEKESKALIEITKMYDKNINTENLIKEEIKNYKNLDVFREWWNKIPCSFTLTKIGVALAYANIRRLVDGIPENTNLSF